MTRFHSRLTASAAGFAAVVLTVVLGLPLQAQEAAKSEAVPEADRIYLPEPDPIPPPVVVTSGTQPERYPDGSLRIERQVIKLSDDQLINNGTYTEYYANGEKFAEGVYDNGVHNGTWTFWHDNGQLCKTVVFKQGRADGNWDVFRPDGTLQSNKTYKDNKRDGKWVAYYEDGKTQRIEEAWKDGVREGVSRTYFTNGKPQREMPFANGEINGTVIEWDESGRKLGEINFKGGKRDGKFILYRNDGTTIEQTYKEGRLLPGGSAS